MATRGFRRSPGVATIAIVTMAIGDLSDVGDAEHFLGGGDAGPDLADAVILQQPHSNLDCEPAAKAGPDVLAQRGAQRLIHDEQLVDMPVRPG